MRKPTNIYSKIFWYSSLILAACLLIYGIHSESILFTGISLIIGVLFRYFGNDVIFSELDKRLERNRNHDLHSNPKPSNRQYYKNK
ncbi:hypothetical protein GCM10025886_19020 [Tetragenococcus halophilus subsp. flandriensis]|nr:hypothetical protein GCM10025886_19020 [Tetragenococcus halophilus subsp. flandriensis]